MIVAFAPATVSNVACGFDVLGFALDAPGDIVAAEPGEAGVVIEAIDGDGGRLSRDPERNTAAVAARALLDRLGTSRGVRLRIQKGIPPASGIGSSGASAVAAVVALNEMLGRPAPLELLLECAMAGEVAACGAAHPDNVAPALHGGMTLVRAPSPPDVISLPVPAGLTCALLHPHLEVPTSVARARLGDSVPLAAATRQWANLGAFVAGLFRGDMALLGRALEDHIAEPVRKDLVPGLAEVEQAARVAGALGCGLSGSGPSIFALCPSLEQAHEVARAMQQAFTAAAGIEADLWVSRVGAPGARIVSA